MIAVCDPRRSAAGVLAHHPGVLVFENVAVMHEGMLGVAGRGIGSASLLSKRLAVISVIDNVIRTIGVEANEFG